MNFITVALAIADEVGIQFRMFLAESLGLFQSHHHEGGSVSVGRCTILGNDGSRKDVVLHRCTDARVDGVCIALSILIIELIALTVAES